MQQLHNSWCKSPGPHFAELSKQVTLQGILTSACMQTTTQTPAEQQQEKQK